MKTIRNLMKNKNDNTHIKSRAKVYEIPSLDCNKKYVGETYCDLKKHIQEQGDLKKRKINNGLIKHNLETNQNFNFKDSKILVHIHKKKHQKTVKSNIISNHNTIKETRFFSIYFPIW